MIPKFFGFCFTASPKYVLTKTALNKDFVERLKSVFELSFETTEKTLNLEDKYRIPRGKVFYMLWCESKFDKDAFNPVSGAYGLFQIMPSTRRHLADLGADECAVAMETEADQLDLLDFYFSLYDIPLEKNLSLGCVYYGHPVNADPYRYFLDSKTSFLRNLCTEDLFSKNRPTYPPPTSTTE
jgi:hypothetical protein